MPVIDQAGSYRAKVIGKDLCYTSTGKEQVAVGFEVTDEGPQHGRHITWYGFFTEAAMGYTFEKMRTLGWTGSDVSDLSGIGESGEVEIVCSEETYNSKTLIKVQFINALGSAGMGIKNTMDAAGKKAFAEKMKSFVLGWDPSASRKNTTTNQVKTSSRQREEPPPPTDADIPF
jgi:hypothetical protein